MARGGGFDPTHPISWLPARCRRHRSRVSRAEAEACAALRIPVAHAADIPNRLLPRCCREGLKSGDQAVKARAASQLSQEAQSSLNIYRKRGQF